MAVEDLCTQTVTVKVKSWSNVRGVRTAVTREVDILAAVQQMSASRVHRHGIEAGEDAFTVFVPAGAFLAAFGDGATGGVKDGDLVVWNGRTMAVQARAKDESGRGVVYSIDCAELS